MRHFEVWQFDSVRKNIRKTILWAYKNKKVGDAYQANMYLHELQGILDTAYCLQCINDNEFAHYYRLLRYIMNMNFDGKYLFCGDKELKCS